MKTNDTIGITLSEIFIVIVFIFLLLLVLTRGSDLQVRKGHQNLTRQYHNLQQDNTLLTELVAKESGSSESLVQNIVTLTGKMSELTRANEQLKEESSDRVSELTQSIEQLKEEISALELARDEVKKKSDALTKKMTELTRANEQLKEESSDRVSELTQSIEQLKEEKKQRKALDKRNKVIEAENKELAQKVETLKLKADPLEKKLEQTIKELKRARVGFDPCWQNENKPHYHFTYHVNYKAVTGNYQMQAIWREARTDIRRLRGRQQFLRDEKLLSNYPNGWISRADFIGFVKKIKSSKISDKCKFVVKVPETVPGKDIKAIRSYIEPVYY